MRACVRACKVRRAVSAQPVARRSRVCRSDDVQTDLKTDVRKVSNCGVNPDRGVHLMELQEAQENNAGTTAAAAAKSNDTKG